MGKKKSKRERKREQREREEAERQAAQEAFEKRRRLYRIGAVIVPLVTLAVAVSVYVGMDNRQLAGLSGMVGLAAWVPMILGALGSQIRPRDRTRAGSIDFGNKR